MRKGQNRQNGALTRPDRILRKRLVPEGSTTMVVLVIRSAIVLVLINLLSSEHKRFVFLCFGSAIRFPASSLRFPFCWNV